VSTTLERKAEATNYDRGSQHPGVVISGGRRSTDLVSPSTFLNLSRFERDLSISIPYSSIDRPASWLRFERVFRARVKKKGKASVAMNAVLQL